MKLKQLLCLITIILALGFSSCQKLSSYGEEEKEDEVIHYIPSGTTGDLIWSHEITDQTYQFYGHPALDQSRQTLYVAAKPMNLSAGDGIQIHAIHGDGSLKWTSVQTQSSQGTSPIIGADGVVYFSSNNVLYALEPATGEVFWTYTLPDRPIEDLYYHPDHKLILIAGGSEGGIAIIGEDGIGIDNTLEGDIDIYKGLAITPDNDLVVQVSGKSYEDGAYKWNYWLVRTSIDLQEEWRVYLKDYQLSGNQITVANNGYCFVPQFFSGEKGKIETYKSDKNLLWTHFFIDQSSVENAIVSPEGNFLAINLSSGIIVISANGGVLNGSLPYAPKTYSMAADDQGYFYANIEGAQNFAVFNTTGDLQWQKSVPWIESSPAIADNGVLLVVGQTRITAIQGYGKLSPSFARARGDNRNTGRGNY